MRIYIPQSPLTLHSSSVAASTLAAWAAGTTYAQSTDAAPVKVQHQASGDTIVREYESLQGSNVGHTPANGGTEWWGDLGPCNRDRMFDGRNNSRSVADSGDPSLTVKFTPPGRAPYLALLGLRHCSSVTVRQYADPSATTPLSTDTTDMTRYAGTVGWWTWLFGTYSYAYRRSLIVPLPGLYWRPCIEVVLSGGLVECGQCLVADAWDLGCTADGAQPSLLSYSTFAPDDYGTVRYVPRQNTRELNLTVWTATTDFDHIFGLLERLEAEIVLIDGNHQTAPDTTDFDALRVYGKITSLRPGLAYDRTPIDIRIQGLD